MHLFRRIVHQTEHGHDKASIYKKIYLKQG